MMGTFCGRISNLLGNIAYEKARTIVLDDVTHDTIIDVVGSLLS